MKTQKTFTAMAGMVVLLVVVLLWTACKKETSQHPIANQESQYIKAFGAVKDDPEAISKVPLLMSAEFQAHGSDAVSSLGDGTLERGKPIKGDIVPPSV